MDLGKILKKVGGSIFKSVVPGGGIVLDAINAVLSDDKKLPKDATGSDIEAAIKTLPPEMQAELMAKKFDVEIKEIEEWSKIVATLVEADGPGSSTRPHIASIMTGLIVFESVLITVLIAYAIGKNNFDMIKAIGTAWTFIAFLIGIPAGIVNSYFGKRTKEKKARYASASGIPAVGVIADIVSALRS
jgi:hypothetical protein